MTIRQAAEAAARGIEGQLDTLPNWEREVLRKYSGQLRAALDAPDIAHELAAALRALLRQHEPGIKQQSDAGDASRAVLRRYDSRKEHA